jgi:FecR-like protein
MGYLDVMDRISKIRRNREFILLYVAGLAVSPAAAADPQKVGQAEIIRNEVVDASEESQLIPINVGDDVMRDAVIRTSADANARFGLIDNTKLTLGPGSTLKIDRAVLADESRYKQITIRLTEGAFRFITGNSDKKSYKIETPSASIGVRGTILDIRISDTETLVALQDGRANVCAGAKCTQLTERGHTAKATIEGGIPQIKRDLVPSWTFASVCSANSSLCSPLPTLTRKANLTAPVLDKAGKKGAITRFCPDGQPMKGSSCGPGLDPLRDTSPLTPSHDLPLLNNPTRDAALPTTPSISSPSLPSTDLGRANLPSATPRLSVPALRR